MLGDVAPDRLRSRMSWLLNQAAVPAQRLVGNALASIGARRNHYALLAALEQFGPASQADLGRRCGIDRSDVVAAINELADGGFVERRPDRADARRNRVVLTSAGRRQLRRLDALLSNAQDQLLAPLDTSERSELVRLLGLIVEHHG